MFYKIITLGCKVNSYESEAMGESLETLGYLRAPADQNADVVLINTCSVTSVADSKSRQIIRREILKNPKAIIGVVGCYAQLEAATIQQIPEVSIIIGTKNRAKIGRYIQDYQKTSVPIVEVEQNILDNHDFDPLSVTSYHEATRAYLKIQDGCNNFCSYCIIPYARGPLRSRDRDEILTEASTLVKNGYQEIVLTGIHTAGYGQDLSDYHFGDLLNDIAKIEGLKRIRISSIEESEIDDQVISALQQCSNIVPHLHIPLQSGCDATLKRMNRKYTTEQYANTIKRLRALFPNIAITTDVIVGFPGETEIEYAQTRAFVESLEFAAVHVFPFSPRKGTPASYMKEMVDSRIKKQRVQDLIQLGTYLSQKYADQFLNQSVEVLVEHYDQVSKLATGHTPNYLKVIIQNAEEDYRNQLKSVVIIQSGFPNNYGIIKS